MRKIITVLIGILILGVCCSAMAGLILQNQFVGISGDMLKNAQARMELAQQIVAQNKPLTKDAISQINRRAAKEIAIALQPYGYFKPKITSKLSHISDLWSATYYINLGPPLRITKLDVKISGAASSDPEFLKLLKNFPLRQDDVFNSETYSATKQKLFALANNRGFLTAKMEKSVVRINLDNYTTTIIIHFNSGPRYSFGPITFAKTKFSSKFLRRFLVFNSGEYYSSHAIQQTQQNMHDSKLFKGVSIEPQIKKTKNRQVPVLIRTTPLNTLQYSVGAGYGTDTGVRGSLGLGINNISDAGQHFTGQVKASQRQASFEASYIIPGKNPVTSQYDISAGSKIEDYAYGHGTLIKLGPGYTTIIHGWQQIIRLDLVSERWGFDHMPGEPTATVVNPNITWLKSKANDPIRPTRGYRISATIQGGQAIQKPYLTFGQGIISAKLIYPIPRGPLLVLRGSLGYTAVQGKQLKDLPMSFWFDAGGAESIRGYSYQDIGPGTELTTASVELRQRFYGNFYGAVFVDMGNANNNIFTSNHDILHTMLLNKSMGLGVVWLSPIGSVQLSYAKPINKPNLEDGVIQFSMGPEL